MQILRSVPVAAPRAAALSLEAMVTANNAAVSAAGLAALCSGGNGIDATLAMAAMCWLACAARACSTTRSARSSS